MSTKFDVFRIKDIANHSKMEFSSYLQRISVKRSTITVPALDGEEVLLVWSGRWTRHIPYSLMLKVALKTQ